MVFFLEESSTPLLTLETFSYEFFSIFNKAQLRAHNNL